MGSVSDSVGSGFVYPVLPPDNINAFDRGPWQGRYLDDVRTEGEGGGLVKT